VKFAISQGARVDVYPVGVLSDLLRIRTALNPCAPRPRNYAPVVPPVGWRRNTIAHAWSSIRRSWRRRNAWNGYLAEPTWQGYWTRCGHGWTQRRALADLNRHLAETRR
jgi:hypothetical protein